MKVKELIKMLQAFDPDETIFISHDEEGNSYQSEVFIQKFPKEVVLYPSGEYTMELEAISDEEWNKFYEEQLKLAEQHNE